AAVLRRAGRRRGVVAGRDLSAAPAPAAAARDQRAALDMRVAELKNTQRELHYFQLRVGFAGMAVVVAFGLLFARFFYLQVIQHDYYHTKAEDNRISIVPVLPNRGLIVDRNDVVLARNYAAYTLEISP